MVRRADFAGIHANGSQDSRPTFGPFFVAQEVKDENFFTTVDRLPQAGGLNLVQMKAAAHRDELQRMQNRVDRETDTESSGEDVGKPPYLNSNAVELRWHDGVDARNQLGDKHTTKTTFPTCAFCFNNLYVGV